MTVSEKDSSAVTKAIGSRSSKSCSDGIGRTSDGRPAGTWPTSATPQRSSPSSGTATAAAASATTAPGTRREAAAQQDDGEAAAPIARLTRLDW